MKTITVAYQQYDDINLLDHRDQELLAAAAEAANGSYSPYSKLCVGAAARLATGEILSAANQENGSFPVSICAERALLGYVMSNRKDLDIQALAIIAQRHGETVKNVSPCGMCRQFITEISNKQNQPIKLIFYHLDKITVVDNASDLLPLNFSL